MLAKLKCGLLIAAVAGAVGAYANSASAAALNDTWTGTTSNNWNTTDLNWTTDGVNSVAWINETSPATALGDNAIFNTTSATVTVTTANTKVNTFNFNTNGWVIASSGSGTLAPGGTGALPGSFILFVNVAATDTATISAPIAASSNSMTMNGPGTLIFSGHSGLTGATTVTGGVFDLNGATGYLGGGVATGTNLTMKGAMFDYDNTTSSGTMSQAMKALAFSAGDSTVLNTLGSATSSTLTYTAATALARTAGATGNFVTTGGTNGTTNAIVLNGTTTTMSAGFINQGTFFNGADYAVMNANNTYVRAANYGTDSTFNATDSGGSLLSSDSLNDNVTTTSITGQTNATVNTIKFSGGTEVDLGLANGQTLKLNSGGLLVSGGTTTVISGSLGANITTVTSGTEYVFRTDTAADHLTVNVPILANGGNVVTKSGAGSATLGGANTYTGATFVDAGELQAGISGGAFGINSNVTLANVPGATLDLNSFSNQIGLLAGGGTLGGNVTLGSGTLTVNSNTSATFAGSISGAGGSLTKINTNVQTLSGTNSYTGPTTISAGRLQFVNEVSLYNNTPASWNAANITVASGATLGLNVGGPGQFTASDVQTLAALGTATTGFLSGSTLGLDATNATGTFTYGNVLANTNSGANVLNFISLGGTILLNRPNTYTGTTTVNGGTLQAGVASVANVSGAFGVNSAVTASGTLDLNNFSNQIGSLTGSGAVLLEGATLTVGGDNTSPATYSGLMSGTGGSLVKIGTGTLQLTNTGNSYTGTTSVTNGTLRLNGLINSPTTVGNAITPGLSPTLGGGVTSGVNGNGSHTITPSGTVANITQAVTILGTSGGSGSAGILAPGNSTTGTYVGTLSVNALTLDSDSIMDYEFSITPTNDLTYVNPGGALTIGTGGDKIVGINLYQASTTTPFATAGTYDLIRYDPSVTIGGDGVGDLTVLNPQAGFNYAFGTTTIGSDNYVTLAISAVPEPASLSLLALGAVGLLARRRRR